MVCHENVHANNITQTEQLIVRIIYVQAHICAHIHITKNNENEVMDLKVSKESYTGIF